MADGIQLTKKYQVMPPMPPEQFESLKADIAERGVLVPIDVDEHGHILDGHHRYRACMELGITDFPTTVRPGLDEEERRIFARKSNMLRRHLSRAQVRELIAEQLKDTPNWANNRIGQVLGADSKTVATVRAKLEATSEIPKFDKLVGADGKARPVKQKRPPAIMAPNADELQLILKRIADGADISKLQGFLSEQGFAIAGTYDPYAGYDEDEIRAWELFKLFLMEYCRFNSDGAEDHVCWLLRKKFKAPAEWLGEEGAKYRRGIGYPKMPSEITTAWEAFFARHDNSSFSDIEALLAKTAALLAEKKPVRKRRRATRRRAKVAA